MTRMTSKIIRKTLEEAQHVQNAEIDFSDKNLIHLDEMPRLWTMKNVTRLTLSHNKITEIPAALVKPPYCLTVLFYPFIEKCQ